MTRTKSRRAQADALELEMERAFHPGRYIAYAEGWGFVSGLEAVRDQVAALVETGEADRAVSLFETFIAGCYEKIEEADDSNGYLGDFAGSLFAGWAAARQGAGASPEETAERLIAFMDADDYGFCSGTEAVEALDRAGLAAYEAAVRRKWEAGRPYGLDKLLKAILVKRRDVEAYEAFCQQAGELSDDDCATLASLCLKKRRLEEALGWVERGLAADRSFSGRLPMLKREILQKMGRGAEALDLAWQAYEASPCTYSYADLMKLVPRNARPEWRDRVLSSLGGVRLNDRIELLVELKEWDLLAETVESAGRRALAALSHYTTEPAAQALEKSHPLTAARLHVALGLRIVEAAKSKYYREALEHFGKARELFGGAAEWDQVTDLVHRNHSRKHSFLPGFERLEEGWSGKEPSFLERAKSRRTR